MIKEVKIYSRFQIKKIALTDGLNFPYSQRPWYLISIYTDEEDNFKGTDTEDKFKQLGCKNMLPLHFWDITDSTRDMERLKRWFGADFKEEDAVLFNDQLAEQVIGFLILCNQCDNEDSVLVVHCDAGISRSGAVGTFAVDYFGLNYNDFIKDNPGLSPNSFVSRILRRKADMSPSFGSGVTDRE